MLGWNRIDEDCQKFPFVEAFADYIHGENGRDFGKSRTAFWRNQIVDLGDSSLDYEACGNCPGVVALGHATAPGVVGQKLRLLCMHFREFGARLDRYLQLLMQFLAIEKRRFAMEDYSRDNCSRDKIPNCLRTITSARSATGTLTPIIALS